MYMPPVYAERAREIESHWNDPLDCYVTFRGGETVHCSSTLLALMSPYFEAALHHGFAESVELQVDEVRASRGAAMNKNLPEVDQDTFMALAHLACGLPVAASDVDNLLLLWGKADRLCMQDVCNALETERHGGDVRLVAAVLEAPPSAAPGGDPGAAGGAGQRRARVVCGG